MLDSFKTLASQAFFADWIIKMCSAFQRTAIGHTSTLLSLLNDIVRFWEVDLEKSNVSLSWTYISEIIFFPVLAKEVAQNKVSGDTGSEEHFCQSNALLFYLTEGGAFRGFLKLEKTPKLTVE